MDHLKFRLRSFTVPDPTYYLHCGSTYELPISGNLSSSDFDHLKYCHDICAIPWNRMPPKNTRCTILRIDSTETPPGYTKLKVDGDSTKDKPSYYRRPRILANVESGGASVQSWEKCGSRPADEYSLDHVFAIYCPYWPPEAEEWRVRNRFHGWPNEKLISRITRGGCHFVSKLRTWSSCDDTEWRFSFSKAELLLIHSWTDVQKKVYNILRVIKNWCSRQCSGNGKKSLQTYYFKTLMFWACEEFSPEFWTEENLITCVETLLFRFLRCLGNKYCSNYFIPKCSIMCHLGGEESFKEELQLIYQGLAGGFIGPVCKKIMDGIKVLSSPLMSLEFNCLKLISSSFPINEDLNGRFSQYLVECEWFLPGMKHLHAAVEAHLRMMSLNSVISRKASKDYVECLENFKCSLISNEDFNSYKYLNPDLSYYENFNVTLLRRLTRNSIPIYRRNLRKSFEDDVYERLHKDSLPSSLFCAALAYRANFYFTAMQSYQGPWTEFNRCVDIIEKAQSIIVTENLNNLISSIPVLICNSLSLIYDEHLQVILGFATLHRNISSFESSNSSTGHEVCLKLNAWEFLKYVYIQSGQKVSAVPMMSAYSCDTYWDFFQPHLSQLVKNGIYSAAVLFAALRQSRVYRKPFKGILVPHHFHHDSMQSY